MINKIDFVGNDGVMIGTSKVSREDYNFIKDMAIKFSWGKITAALRLMIKFAKENKDQFQEYVDNLRNNETPLL